MTAADEPDAWSHPGDVEVPLPHGNVTEGVGRGRRAPGERGVLLRNPHAASASYAADRAFAAPPGTSWFVWPALAGSSSAVLPPEPPRELVSHLDITPQDVVVREGRAVGLIDFDLAGPTTRLADLVTTAMH